LCRNIITIPNSSLFISQPEPSHFGNSPNEPNNKNWNNQNWLKSFFHFSFAGLTFRNHKFYFTIEYYDPKNIEFGVLRVINDDLIQPMRGFGRHPHKNMEIITYIVSGSI